MFTHDQCIFNIMKISKIMEIVQQSTNVQTWYFPVLYRQCSAIGVIQWDVCNLPLRTASLDIIVTDMVQLP